MPNLVKNPLTGEYSYQNTFSESLALAVLNSSEFQQLPSEKQERLKQYFESEDFKRSLDIKEKAKSYFEFLNKPKSSSGKNFFDTGIFDNYSWK